MKKIIPLIIIAIFSYIFYLVYTQATKSVKVKRLDCQSSTTTFERIFFDTPIKNAIELLTSNNYVLDSRIEYSRVMKSNLKDKLLAKDIDEKLNTIISQYIKSNTQNSEKLNINYYLYENDKNDSNKKNEEAKKYAGYLMFEFKLDNKLIYKIQTDYMNIDGSDINERLSCVINSFVSIIKD